MSFVLVHNFILVAKKIKKNTIMIKYHLQDSSMCQLHWDMVPLDWTLLHFLLLDETYLCLLQWTNNHKRVKWVQLVHMTVLLDFLCMLTDGLIFHLGNAWSISQDKILVFQDLSLLINHSYKLLRSFNKIITITNLHFNLYKC